MGLRKKTAKKGVYEDVLCFSSADGLWDFPVKRLYKTKSKMGKFKKNILVNVSEPVRIVNDFHFSMVSIVR